MILLLLAASQVSVFSSAKTQPSKASPQVPLRTASSAEFHDVAQLKPAGKTVTPEMFGAIGDGRVHYLSEKYTSISEARKAYPNVRDLKITIDGAAFQQAVDKASEDHGEVLAERSYVISSPIVMRDNVIVDGNNKGLVRNDRSRGGSLNFGFLFGDHAPYGFNKEENHGAGYDFYDVREPMKIGQSSLTLKNPADASLFKPGQLVLITSSVRRGMNLSKVTLPYHVTMARIERIDDARLSFEYPFDEDVDAVQICANGNFDSHLEINFGGVQNVVLRNMTIDASQITGSQYAYKCHIDNIRLIDGVRLVGMNAMAHSTFTNITGTFSWRCMEIKTGSHDLLVRNIHGTYKPIAGFPQAVDAISIGQYNRNVTVDGFEIDFGDSVPKIANINFHSRKATISNGTVICRKLTEPFVRFYNERYVDNPLFGCYGNTLKHVTFHGGPGMKTVFELGNGLSPNAGKRKDNWVTQKKLSKGKHKSQATDEEKEDLYDAPKTADVPPSANIIENCLFDGGARSATAKFQSGHGNVIVNCEFPSAKMKASRTFLSNNTMRANRFK